MVLTVGFHVPRNNSLAAVDPSGAESPKHWEHYVAEWVPWNHARALAALAASGCFVVALIAR